MARNKKNPKQESRPDTWWVSFFLLLAFFYQTGLSALIFPPIFKCDKKFCPPSKILTYKSILKEIPKNFPKILKNLKISNSLYRTFGLVFIYAQQNKGWLIESCQVAKSFETEA